MGICEPVFEALSIAMSSPAPHTELTLRRACALAALLVVLPAWGLVLGGCQVSMPIVREHLEGEILTEADGYRFDPRWEALSSDFQTRMRGALERLEVVAGLRFPASRVPEVILRPFGDETIPYEMRARIVDGRRRVSIHINAEPLMGGVLDPDRVLLRALADAAFQDAAQRHGAVPRWMTEMAGTVVSGELPVVLERLHRRMLAGDNEVLRLDNEDAAVAVQTGAAALILLTERGQPDDIRHLLQSVADGDGADSVMARLAHEPDGTWLRPANTAYRLRLSSLDDAPWRLLARARAAVDESGGAGLESVLPSEIPLEVIDEIRLLRAKAAADEGNHAVAASLLAELSADAPSRLEDPASALALRIRVESRPGGNVDLARRLALQLDSDFPRSAARASLRRSHPLLGMEEDPQRWLRTMRGHIARSGTEGLDLAVIERYARTLLQDHRAGEAERFVFGLGERGTAPELAEVRRAIRDAQEEPMPAAAVRGAERVSAWQLEPDEESWADVVATGAAADKALSTLLEGAVGAQRRQVIELMAETLGPTVMIDRVRADWTDNQRFVALDIEAIAAHAPYPAIRDGLGVDQLAALPFLDRARAEQYWERMTFGLSNRWLRAHPDFLQETRSETFAVRQAAFETIMTEAPREATPTLIAHGLKDPAALLRREATKLAGEIGFSALVRRALKDEAWFVREEATRAVIQTEGPRCVDALLSLLADDPSIEVRGAAALGLLTIAPDEDRVIDALLATQVSEEVKLRDAIATRMTQLDKQRVVRGIDRGWQRALRRRDPSRSYLFRTSLLFQRLTGEDLGYYPGAPRGEMREMHGRIRAWLAQAPRTDNEALRMVSAGGGR